MSLLANVVIKGASSTSLQLLVLDNNSLFTQIIEKELPRTTLHQP
jgi:hypothetical protein